MDESLDTARKDLKSINFNYHVIQTASNDMQAYCITACGQVTPMHAVKGHVHGYHVRCAMHCSWEQRLRSMLPVMIALKSVQSSWLILTAGACNSQLTKYTHIKLQASFHACARIGSACTANSQDVSFPSLHGVMPSMVVPRHSAPADF